MHFYTVNFYTVTGGMIGLLPECHECLPEKKEAQNTDTRSLRTLLENLKARDGEKKESVSEIVAAFKRQRFGPLLFVPARFLVLLLPTSAIPSMPVAYGLICKLICGPSSYLDATLITGFVILVVVGLYPLDRWLEERQNDAHAATDDSELPA